MRAKIEILRYIRQFNGLTQTEETRFCEVVDTRREKNKTLRVILASIR